MLIDDLQSQHFVDKKQEQYIQLIFLEFDLQKVSIDLFLLNTMKIHVFQQLQLVHKMKVKYAIY